jgi:peptide/nickel transport system ATP-binding protein
LTPLLEVHNLKTSFRSDDGPIRAVRDVSFTLERGETFGIVGESGSGKSVTARSLMNLHPKSAIVEGTVLFEGKDVRELSKDKHFWGTQIAMVFQDPMTSLNPVRKIGQQLTDPLRFHLDIPAGEAQQRAVALLREVGIPEPERRLKQYPHELSGGMRQRVAIAIALSCEPKLLIADEPTTALDVTVQRQVLDLLGSIQRDRDMSIVLITHDLGVVATRARRVAVMYAGEIVEIADTRTLFSAMRHPYTKALFESIPRLGGAPHRRLAAIDGRPPSALYPPPGCQFAARCRSARERCRVESPVLSADQSDATHLFSCFFPCDVAPDLTALGEEELPSVDNLRLGAGG